MKKEDKLKILARLFFQDNQDDYEDFRAAEVEFMANQPTDMFIEFCLKPILSKKRDDNSLVMNSQGHVASVRHSDGYFEPLTEMTQDDGSEMEDAFHEASEKYPDLDGLDLLVKTDWKVIL